MIEDQQKNYSRKIDGKEAIDVIDVSKEDYDNWMNIDMVMAALSKGDRQIRRYIINLNWDTRWLKEDGKVKTFILKKNVLEFLDKRKKGEVNDPEEEEEKKNLHLPERTEQSFPDIPLFSAIRQVSAELSLTLPELIKNYKEVNDSVRKLTEEKSQISNKVIIWKSSTIWIGAIGVIVCGILSFIYFESKSELIKNKNELTVVRQEKDTIKDKFSSTEKELMNSQYKIEDLQKAMEERSTQIQKLEEKVSQIENPQLKKSLDNSNTPEK